MLSSMSSPLLFLHPPPAVAALLAVPEIAESSELAELHGDWAHLENHSGFLHLLLGRLGSVREPTSSALMWLLFLDKPQLLRKEQKGRGHVSKHIKEMGDAYLPWEL